MKKVQIGNLTIGDIPRVVGTLTTFDSLSRFPSLNPKPCDIAEVRLDQIGHTTAWMPVCRQIENSGTPVLLTFRTVEEGGNCNQPAEIRTHVFKEALPSVSAIDVELSS